MESRTIILIIEAVAIVLIVALSVGTSFFYARRHRKLKLCHEFLRSQLELQEKSFDNIYREIHDNIGQSLSLVKLNLNTVEADPALFDTEKINYSKNLVGKAILDLRVLGKSLNANFINQIGLNEAIKRELFRSARRDCCKVVLEEVGHPSKFKDYEELIIFRIFLELLNGSFHHLQSKRVTINLGYKPEVFVLSVAAEGRAFSDFVLKSNPQEAYPNFDDLRERAELIDAELELKNLPEAGVMAVVKLPLKKKAKVVGEGF